MVNVQQGNFGCLASLATGCLVNPLSVKMEFPSWIDS